jgi:hypothetical protein
MKLVLSTIASLAVVASLAACGGEPTGAAPAGSGSVKAATRSSAASSAKATDTAKPAETAKAAEAPAFPAQPVPAPFETLTIGAPTGAKLETGVTKDYVMIEGPDYAFKIEEEKENDIPKIKEMLTKGGAKLVVDEADGMIAEMKDKDATSLNVIRYVKIGDKGYGCSTTMKGAPKTEEKAKEAYAVCGSLKAK